MPRNSPTEPISTVDLSWLRPANIPHLNTKKAYAPKRVILICYCCICGRPCGIRTCDQRIKSPQCHFQGVLASIRFRRYLRKAELTVFDMYDLKEKGATHMMGADVPIERIQHLLGHESVTTTEIYVKARFPRYCDAEHAESNGH
jgi:integrase